MFAKDKAHGAMRHANFVSDNSAASRVRRGVLVVIGH